MESALFLRRMSLCENCGKDLRCEPEPVFCLHGNWLRESTFDELQTLKK